MRKPQEISKIIVKYLLDLSNDEENKKLDLWLDEDIENKKMFERLKNEKYLNNGLGEMHQINANSDWYKVKYALKNKSKKIYLNISRYAAAIILILGIVGVINYIMRLKDINQEVELAEIIPGSPKATLVLADGKKIDLEKEKGLLFNSNAGIEVISEDAEVKYNQEQEKIDEKEGIEWHTIQIPRGGEYKLVLSDGTIVWLNADTQLRYPVSFIGKKRHVFLKGEAYFAVAHNKEKSFVVNSYGQSVRAYGTEFNVNAYHENEIKTVLVEGSVGVRKEGTKEVIIKPGQLAVGSKTGIKVKDVNVHPYVAWKDGDFVFQRESLANIMERLGRWYNVDVFYQNPDTKKSRFTCDMKRYSEVEDLLYFMEQTSDIQFVVQGRIILVRSK